MPNETIRPALTREQWAAKRTDYALIDAAGFKVPGRGEWPHEAEPIDPHDARGIAALALYGQPFGFTEADVALIRRAAAGADAYTVDEWERWSSLADRIAALLPR